MSLLHEKDQAMMTLRWARSLRRNLGLNQVQGGKNGRLGKTWKKERHRTEIVC